MGFHVISYIPPKKNMGRVWPSNAARRRTICPARWSRRASTFQSPRCESPGVPGNRQRKTVFFHTWNMLKSLKNRISSFDNIYICDDSTVPFIINQFTSQETIYQLFTFTASGLLSPGDNGVLEERSGHRNSELLIEGLCWCLEGRWVIGCSKMFAMCLEYWQQVEHVLIIWRLDWNDFQDLWIPHHISFLKRPILAKLEGPPDLEFTQGPKHGTKQWYWFWRSSTIIVWHTVLNWLLLDNMNLLVILSNYYYLLLVWLLRYLLPT